MSMLWATPAARVYVCFYNHFSVMSRILNVIKIQLRRGGSAGLPLRTISCTSATRAEKRFERSLLCTWQLVVLTSRHMVWRLPRNELLWWEFQCGSVLASMKLGLVFSSNREHVDTCFFFFFLVNTAECTGLLLYIYIHMCRRAF